jgi:hypothetical protein
VLVGTVPGVDHRGATLFGGRPLGKLLGRP